MSLGWHLEGTLMRSYSLCFSRWKKSWDDRTKKSSFYGTVRSKSEYSGRSIEFMHWDAHNHRRVHRLSDVILRIKSTTVTPLFNELSVSTYKHIELSMYLCGESKIKVGNQLLKQFWQLLRSRRVIYNILDTSWTFLNIITLWNLQMFWNSLWSFKGRFDNIFSELKIWLSLL